MNCGTKKKILPSMEQANMSERRSNGSKPEPISKSKESTQINPPLLSILHLIYLKLTIDNRGYIIRLTLPSKQVRGKYGERFGIVHIKSPIGNGSHNVHNQSIAHKYIGNGEKWRNERAE